MKKPIRPRLKPAAHRLPPLYWPSAFLAVGLMGLSLLNQVAVLHPGLDLLGQFKVQFYLALLLPLLLMALMRRWRFVLGLVFCLGLNAAEILPWYLPVSESKAQASFLLGREVKVFQANVLNTNSNVTALAKQIVQEQPDIVILLEFHPQHLTMMNGLGRAYPYRFTPPNKQYFGLGIWSRYPMNKTLLRFLGQSELPTLETRLEVDTQELHLLVTHLDSPVRVPAIRRNRQLNALGKHLQDIRPPVLVVGDLNVSMWSPYYKKFEKLSGLRNGRKGFGILPTWPSFFHPLVQIPIDHCLISPDLSLSEIHTGANVGSDHLPLIFNLHLSRPPDSDLHAL